MIRGLMNNLFIGKNVNIGIPTINISSLSDSQDSVVFRNIDYSMLLHGIMFFAKMPEGLSETNIVHILANTAFNIRRGDNTYLNADFIPLLNYTAVSLASKIELPLIACEVIKPREEWLIIFRWIGNDFKIGGEPVEISIYPVFYLTRLPTQIVSKNIIGTK